MNNTQNTENTVLEFVNEKEFREGVIPRALLSKLACEIALQKSANNNIREFAGWELLEAVTVIDILQDLDTAISDPGPDGTSFLKKIEGLSGEEFDKAYIDAELSNHEFLCDLAQNYLDNPAGKPSGRDKETWHVAGLALFSFTEHVGLCKKLLAGLQAK